MADAEIEHELCANCKKEIPQCNYVMHMAHCARNITLCPVCKIPVPKNTFAAHKKKHEGGGGARTKEKTPPRRPNEENLTKKLESVRVNGSKATVVKATKSKSNTFTSTLSGSTDTTSSSKPSCKSDGLLACKYCELELPKLELEDHENYCGTRTDKCIECGEFVMFKYKKLHEDSNHGFVKLQDEPGPRPSWDSTTQRSTATSETSNSSLYQRRSLPPLRPFDMYTNYNMADYIPPPMPTRPQTKDKSETYKDISRRLDCKTEYIRNLLHDSASITAPLRTGPTSPRNHYSHNKVGPAPQPPSRRRNPPTELTIPCEFCDTPIPHEDLIQHETGCRPDLARFNPRRRSPELDEFFVAQAPASPEVELPCEFCSDMIPASQLLRHQATCM